MRVFVTGATGYVGSAVVRELKAAGHVVVGLARSGGAAKALIAAGVEPHHGSLDDHESLKRGAAKADGVIHLAFIHGLGGATLGERLRIFFGGAPSGLIGRFLAVSAGADRAAIAAMAEALQGSGRPLVTTFGTMGLASAVANSTGTERDAPNPSSPGFVRARAEELVDTWAARGVRASVVRLPPSVHGDGDTGFLTQLIAVARKKGESGYVGEGRNRWSGVHQRDAAILFRLALEKGRAGARYHGVADEGVAFRSIAEVIGRRLSAPVVTKTAAQAAKQFSWLAPFMAADNPVSSRLTRDELGWSPHERNLIEDLDRPAYFNA